MDSRLRRQAHLHSEDVVSKWNLLKALLQFHAFLASGVLFTHNYGIVCLVDVGIKYSFVAIRIDGAQYPKFAISSYALLDHIT